MQQQHPLFIKYTRDWLHDITGYSKVYLCRVSTGKVPLSRSFVERVSFRLREPAEALFLLDASNVTSGNTEHMN